MRKYLKRLGTFLLFLVVALCFAASLVPPFLDRIYYEGPVSDHYDGARFYNPDGDDTAAPPSGGSRTGFLARRLTGAGERAAWPENVAVTPARPAPRVDGSEMVATWVGHATMLVQTQGLNILTDPIWSDHAGPFGLGPRRVAEPGIRFEDLPKIDLILVSHNHYDHMDLDTLKRLWDRDRPTIVTSLGNDTLLNKQGIEARAVDWGARMALRPGIEVAVTRNHHWGSRWFVDRNRALWSSFTVRLPGGNIFFAGDTGMGDGRWPGEAAALGPVRLAILPIGAFRFARGQMGTGSHIGPIDAARVFSRLGAAEGIAIHWGTFRLSDEGYDTPPKMLAEVMRCARAPADRFRAVRIAEAVSVAPLGAPRTREPDAACLTRDAVTRWP